MWVSLEYSLTALNCIPYFPSDLNYVRCINIGMAYHKISFSHYKNHNRLCRNVFETRVRITRITTCKKIFIRNVKAWQCCVELTRSLKLFNLHKKSEFSVQMLNCLSFLFTQILIVEIIHYSSKPLNTRRVMQFNWFTYKAKLKSLSVDVLFG